MPEKPPNTNGGGGSLIISIPAYIEYTITFPDVDEYKTPNPKSISYTAIPGNIRVVNCTYIFIPTIDLSTVNIYGEPIKKTTANCYVVKEPGKYIIPIAYGTAIKNGEINATAYTNNGGSNSHDFLNYKGNVITSPYVEVDTTTQASIVQMSIADTERAVSELEIIDGDDCRYIKFNVNDVPEVGGNAVISIKDSDNKIMWSWHIWLWSDDLTPVEITNNSNVTYKILPVNLASKWDDSSKYCIKSWFYQFGRPTPLLCQASQSSSNFHQKYGVLSHGTSNATTNLINGIINPNIFYKKTTVTNKAYNWFSTNGEKYWNLWDAACTQYGQFDNNVIKTVYDPCPVGFKIPNGKAFDGFAKINNIDSYYIMSRYNGDSDGIRIQKSSNIYSSNGSIRYSGIAASFWTSANNGLSGARYWQTNGSNTYVTYDSPAEGVNVRPVKDDDLTLSSHKLTIGVSGDTVTPSGFKIDIYNVIDFIDSTTGEITETLGDLIATQTALTTTHEIVWGTKYRIVASDVNGFVTPASQTYVADSVSRNVGVVYEAIKEETLVVNVSASDGSSVIGSYVVAELQSIPNGIYIQDINGALYTTSEWDGSSTPNGIAVVTDSCKFVMALSGIGLKKWSSATQLWGHAFTNESDAKADYNGWKSSIKIVNNTYPMDYAANSAYDYIFPNGNRGYLGSTGEWACVASNYNAIVAALQACGSSFDYVAYWTSTEYDKDNAWYHGVTANRAAYDAKTTADRPVWAFTVLGEQRIINDTSFKATFTIPAGTNYRVYVGEKDGYITPQSQAFTAGDGTRTISMQYVYHEGTNVPSNGVWIQDTDGFYHTANAWSGKYTPNGIAVVTANCSFVMALEDAHTSTTTWSVTAGTTVSGITTTTATATAKADYNGNVQTSTILSSLGGGTNCLAAHYCRTYTFPNGNVGYLPAAGEWAIAGENGSSINAALSACGKAKITSGYEYWTSTQYNASNAWYGTIDIMPINYSYLNNKYKTGKSYVRAFTTL